MLRGYAGGVAYPYPTRIGYGYALDTPWICFHPYPKNMDTYRLRYVYPTRMEHVFEREVMGRERRESERRRHGCARAGGERLGGLDGGGMRTEELGAVDWRQGVGPEAGHGA
jgi:hypothetical protein